MVYTIATFFVLALIVALLGAVLFLVSLVGLIMKSGVLAISRVVRMQASALAGMRFRAQAPAAETHMRA